MAIIVWDVHNRVLPGRQSPPAANWQGRYLSVCGLSCRFSFASAAAWGRSCALLNKFQYYKQVWVEHIEYITSQIVSIFAP